MHWRVPNHRRYFRVWRVWRVWRAWASPWGFRLALPVCTRRGLLVWNALKGDRP